MNRYNFNRTGTERKQLVGAISEILNIGAISEILNAPMKYLGAPTFAYEVGDYHIDKEGTVTGEENPNLLAELAARGFAPEPLPEPETDRVVIEVPNDFTPEALENLRKMVEAKADLIQMAVGTAALPIEVTPGKVSFDWFNTSDSEKVVDYATFVSLLCATAKEKKRVTAKAGGDRVNPRFSFRVFLLSLGMIGPVYKRARHTLLSEMPGNSAWSSGIDPRRKTPAEAAPAPEAEKAKVQGDD